MDNLGVISAFCTGLSSVGELNGIIHTALLRIAGRHAAARFEQHVESASKAVDGETLRSGFGASVTGQRVTNGRSVRLRLYCGGP